MRSRNTPDFDDPTNEDYEMVRKLVTKNSMYRKYYFMGYYDLRKNNNLHEGDKK